MKATGITTTITTWKRMIPSWVDHWMRRCGKACCTPFVVPILDFSSFGPFNASERVQDERLDAFPFPPRPVVRLRLCR